MNTVKIFENLGISVNREIAFFLVDQARFWAMDCTWSNVDANDILDMSDLALVNNVRKHWDGGIVDFVTAHTTQAKFS